MQTFRFTPEATWYRRMEFSPDGQWLALSGKPFTLFDTTGARGLVELPLGDFRWDFAFTRRGAGIAYLPSLQSLEEYDLETGEKRTRRVLGSFPHFMAADRAATTLYLSGRPALPGRRSGIRVFSVAGLRQRGSFGPAHSSLGRLSLSGDGGSLACDSWDYLRVWRLDGRRLPRRHAFCLKMPNDPYSFALSHNGSRLAVAHRRTVALWDTAGRKRVARSGRHGRTVTSVACSPTRPVIASADTGGRVFFWDAAGRLLKRYDWGLAEVIALTFDADGLRCAALDEDRRLVIWDVDP